MIHELHASHPFQIMRGNMANKAKRLRGDTTTFWLFVAPNVLIFAAFTFWPVIYSAWLSLHEGALFATPTFIALKHYGRLVADPAFWQVMKNTLVYAVAVVVIAQAIALLLALCMNRPMPGRALWRTIVFTPQVTTPAAAALIWVVILQADIGPLSRLYTAAGAQGGLLDSSDGALWALVIAGAWKEISFATIFFLAGLQNLPRDVYEAAMLDAAGPVRRLRSITLPLLSPVIFFLLVSGFVASAKTFDTVALMTQGGPVYPESSLMVYHLYKLAFRDSLLGYASAFAVVAFTFLTILLMAKFWLARRFVHYD